MKQVLQNFKTGELDVHDVPAPMLQPAGVLVRTHYSLISTGTEGGTVSLAKKNLLDKARARPDLVHKVLNLARTDGVMTAYDAVVSNLDSPVPLGYSASGEVIEVGELVNDLQVGDEVACMGSLVANHAEINFVPRNMCARLPQGVDTRSACFCMLGAIALNGVRRADVDLGSHVLVIGLGLIGQLTVQLLKAAGCRVFGVDLEADKVELARRSGADNGMLRGAENLEESLLAFSDGRGVDATILTAATKSADPVALAGRVTRQRGRVVAVGRIPYELPRDEYLFKEIAFFTSFAFGPGVNDSSYETRGVDYPAAHVRWSGNRNLQAFLELVADGRLDLAPLITHQFPISEAKRAFDLVSETTAEPTVAVLLKYDVGAIDRRGRIELRTAHRPPAGKPRPGVGVIGAGSHAVSNLLDAIDAQHVNKRGIVSASGFRSKWYGEKYGFAYAASDVQELFDDQQLDAVFILSRHDSHAELTARALEHGKDVFVEKPLCLTLTELTRIIAAHEKHGGRIMVGYNRRYATLGVKLKAALAQHAQPVAVTYRMNAGIRPADHWLHDVQAGGGLILGEAVHFLDFMQFIIAAQPVRVTAQSIHSPTHDVVDADSVVVTVQYDDGSLGVMSYLSGGDKSFGRERIEVFADNMTAALEDWRSLVISKNGKRQKTSHTLKQEKGFRPEVAALVDAIADGKPLPASFDEVVAGMRTALAAVESLRTGQSVDVACDSS